MGGLFAQDGGALTKPALQLPSGDVKFYDSPQARAGEMVNYDVKTLQPNTADLPAQIGQDSPGTFQDNSVAQPQPVKPSFREASQDRYGLPNPNNQGLTKLGVLTKFLAGAAQGAAAGSQVRGFGQGMQAAQVMPLQNAMLRQEAERGGLQNDVMRNQVQQNNALYTLPDGRKVPFWLAKHNADLAKLQAEAENKNYIRNAGGTGGVFSIRDKGIIPGTESPDKNTTVENQLATAVQKAIEGKRDPSQDPTVQQISDVITAKMREPGAQTNPDAIWYRAFKAEHQNAEPGTADLMGYLKTKAQNIHITNPPPSSLTSTPEIKPNTPAFKTAQDLAYGKLTFQNFRTLVAYGRDTGAKMAIYAKAAELNPSFNPAAFEMGFNFAKNPKVQQQLSSLDNVMQAIPDLASTSDAASRTGIKKLNQITNWAGTQFGGKKYSNFKTAQIAFADELSGALGYGSATDMSREMGFNMTDPNLSPDQFRDGLYNVVAPFIQRKRATMLNQMGVYGQANMNPAADAPQTPPGSGAAVNPSPSTNPPPPAKQPKLPPVAAGYVRFRDSQGGTHDIPKANLDAAKQRDPGLTVF